MVLIDYNKNLTLNISSRDFEVTFSSDNPGIKDGIYTIRDLYIPAYGDKFSYPFDQYIVDITFKTEDGWNLNLSGLKDETESSSRWSLEKQWNKNNLHLIFTRSQEKIVFLILVFLALLLIITNLILLKKTKNNWLLYINDFFHIPFFFGVIFNYIIYDVPSYFSISVIVLISALVISILLGGFVYNTKSKK